MNLPHAERNKKCQLMIVFVLVGRPVHRSRKSLEDSLEDGTHHFLGIEAIPLGYQARDNIQGISTVVLIQFPWDTRPGTISKVLAL